MNTTAPRPTSKRTPERRLSCRAILSAMADCLDEQLDGIREQIDTPSHGPDFEAYIPIYHEVATELTGIGKRLADLQRRLDEEAERQR